jgi:hypothetical protein
MENSWLHLRDFQFVWLPHKFFLLATDVKDCFGQLGLRLGRQVADRDRLRKFVDIRPSSLQRRARNNGFGGHCEREFDPPPPTTQQSSRVGSLKKPSVHVHAKLLFSGFGSAMFHSRIVLQG